VKTTVPPREDVEPAVDGDADLEEAHRNQGSRNALCALPSYTSGIQEKKDPPAVSRPRKNSNFRYSRHCCQSYHSRRASPHYYGIITSYKSSTASIPTPWFHQQQHQHRPQIFISNLRQVPRSSAIREPPHSRGVEHPHSSNHYWSLKRQKLSLIPRCLRYPSSRSRSSWLLFNFDFAFSVFSCYSSLAVLYKAFSRTTAVLRTFSVSFTVYRYFPALSRHLVAIAIRLVQPSLYLGPHPVVLQTTSLYCYRSTVPSSLPLSSQFLKLSSRSHPVAVYAHLRGRPLHPRHESQHPSLAGARPLERAYCHKSRYISYGLSL
jgi:hypothetical protein